MQTKIKNKISLVSQSNKYLFLSIFVFAILFFSTFKVFGLGAPTVTINATPTSVLSGRTSIISWESDGADSCILSGGNIMGSGTTNDSPGVTTNPITTNTTYKVTCTDSGTGTSTSKSVTVTVTSNLPTITVLTATPSSIVSGSTSSIHWEATNANSCTSAGGGGNGTTGTFTTPVLTTSTNYTVTCTNSAGTVSSFVTVTVTNNGGGNPGIPVVTVVANPPTIPFNTASTIFWSSTGTNDYCVAPSANSTGTDQTGSFVTPLLLKDTSFSVKCDNGGDYYCVDSASNKQTMQCSSGSKSGCESDKHGVSKVCSWVLKTHTNRRTGTGTVKVTVIPPPGTHFSYITDILTKAVSKNVSDPSTSVWFAGEMNPGADKSDGTARSANAYFRYSPLENQPPIFCNDIFGSQMKATNEVSISGNTIQQVKIQANNLEPNTKYYYCIVGSSDDEIVYGGVRSFTTDLAKTGNDNTTKNDFSISTSNALVVDSTSAYLNGSFNTAIPAETFFMYRKSGDPWQVQNIGLKKHNSGTSGNISYLLTGLTPGTTYQFKAVIRASGSGSTGGNQSILNKISSIIENFFNVNKVLAAVSNDQPGAVETLSGDTFEFTTQSDSVIGDGTGDGTPYTDPCTNTTTDVNCNGAGNTADGPDLIAGQVTPAFAIVNVPVTLVSSIRNIGKASTVKGFSNFFQISTVDPTLINNNTNSSGTGTNNTKGTGTNNNSTTNSSNGLNSANQKTNNTNKNSVTSAKVSFLDYIFGTNKVLAAATASGGSVVDQTIKNIPKTSMSALEPNASAIATQVYTFPTIGKYYVRACADKSSPVDSGVITETNENNNCSPWTVITINLTGTNTGNDNYNNGNVNNTNPTTNPTNLKLGDIATPPIDATVHYHEGIETVLQRQIVAETNLAKAYGYQDGADLQTFAWDLADLLARTFGYVSTNGKEIRVSVPDIAAYQLYMNNGILTVYEYYDSKIVNIQKMTDVLRNKYYYEYYFKK